MTPSICDRRRRRSPRDESLMITPDVNDFYKTSNEPEGDKDRRGDQQRRITFGRGVEDELRQQLKQMEIELVATARLSENEVAESEADRHRALETAAQANARSAAASRSASRPTYGDYQRLRQYTEELEAERRSSNERQAESERKIGEVMSVIKTMAEKMTAMDERHDAVNTEMANTIGEHAAGLVRMVSRF